MALFNGVDMGGAAKGVAIGIGVAIVAPVVITSLFGASRPLARAGIKAGLIFYEKSRETFAEVAEIVEDLVAEAQAEVTEEHLGHAGADGAVDDAGPVVESSAQRSANDGVSS